MECTSKEIRIYESKYKIIACSSKGEGKIENQDSYGLYFDEEQILVILADGLGSAMFSKEGSSKIVKVAIEVLTSHSSYDEMPLNILKKWKASLDGNADSYDTTVKFIQIKKDKIVYGGIGDGWIAINKKDKFVSLCSNNVFSNQTDSILSFDLMNKFLIKEQGVEDIKNMLISTDGFSEDFDKENGKKFMDDSFNFINDDCISFQNDLKSTLENWPVTSNKDDKTVIFIQKMGS